MKSCWLATVCAAITAVSHAAERRIVNAGPIEWRSIPHRTPPGVSTNAYRLMEQTLEVFEDPQDPSRGPIRAMRYFVLGPEGKKAVVYCAWDYAGDITVCRDNQGTDWLIWIENYAILMRKLDPAVDQKDTGFRVAEEWEMISSRIYADQVITELPNSVTLDGGRADRMELTFLGVERAADGTFTLKARTPGHRRQVTITGKDGKWECLVVEPMVREEQRPPD